MFLSTVMSQQVSRCLKQRLRLLAADGREVIQEGFKAISCLEIVEQVLDGNPGASEAGRAAHSLGIYLYNLIQVHNATIITQKRKQLSEVRVGGTSEQ